MAEARPSQTRLPHRNFARGARVFCLLAVAASVLVVALTASRQTVASLINVRWLWLLATAGLWLVAVTLDGLRLAVLSRTGDRPLTALRTVSVVFIGYFMAAVTPLQVGCLPVQLYVLHGWGNAPGRSSAMLLLRGGLLYAVLLAAAPLVALGLGAQSALLKVLAINIALAAAGGTLLVAASVVFPSRLSTWRANLLRGPAPRRARRLLVWVLGELGGFAGGLKLYLQRGNHRHLLLAAALTLAFVATLLGMSVTLLLSLGVQADPLRTAGLSLVVCTVTLFMPTPGAAGIAEVGAAGLFSIVCPRHMLGAYVLLWRLFSFYLGAVIGGIVTFRLLSNRPGLPAASMPTAAEP